MAFVLITRRSLVWLEMENENLERKRESHSKGSQRPHEGVWSWRYFSKEVIWPICILEMGIGYGESIQERQEWRKDTLGSNPGRMMGVKPGDDGGNGEQCICWDTVEKWNLQVWKLELKGSDGLKVSLSLLAQVEGDVFHSNREHIRMMSWVRLVVTPNGRVHYATLRSLWEVWAWDKNWEWASRGKGEEKSELNSEVY